MKNWDLMGGWITFALALSAFIFSVLCYRMLLDIRQVIEVIRRELPNGK